MSLASLQSKAPNRANLWCNIILVNSVESFMENLSAKSIDIKENKCGLIVRYIWRIHNEMKQRQGSQVDSARRG